MAAPALPDPRAPQAGERLRAHLRQGGLAVLPTDTVPGLAIDAATPDAAAILARAKASQPGRPYSLHLRSRAELRAMLPALPPGLAAWLEHTLPGPVTVVVPRAWVALPSDWHWPWPTVGLRLPDDSAYSAWADACPGPLLMTSVNAAGEPPLSGAALEEWLAARPEILSCVDPSRLGNMQASTVLAFEPLPKILRKGDFDWFASARPGLKVLCLCTGNTCRSPLAEALLRRELAAAWGVAENDLAALGWEVRSAGIAAASGAPASEGSLIVGAEEGIDLAEHRSTALEEALAWGPHLVLAMSESHLHALPPSIPSELFDAEGHGIPDPFGAPVEIYRATRAALQRAAEIWVQRASAWPE